MDLSRYEDFKPKFLKWLHQQECGNDGSPKLIPSPKIKKRKSAAACNTTGELSFARRISDRCYKPAAPPVTSNGQSSPNNSSTATLETVEKRRRGRPPVRPKSTVVANAPTSVPPTPTPTPRQTEAKLIVSAFKSADDLMKTFYQSINKGVHQNAQEDHFKCLGVDELAAKFKEHRTAAMEILETAANGDKEVCAKLKYAFDSANYLKLQKNCIEARQREFAAITVDNLIRTRFNKICKGLNAESGERFQNAVNIQGQFYDALELEVIRGFGDQWEAQYWKLASAKAHDIYKAVARIREYKNKMTAFMGPKLCVDESDLDIAGAQVLYALPEGPNGSELKEKVASITKEMRRGFEEQVAQNRKCEEASVEKALKVACTQFERIFYNAMEGHEDLEVLHQTVLRKLKSAFNSVPDFRYTMVFKWPEEEPKSISEYVLIAKEYRKLKLVLSIKEKAASLLRQLGPDQQERLLEEVFPGRRLSVGLAGGEEGAGGGGQGSGAAQVAAKKEEHPKKSFPRTPQQFDEDRPVKKVKFMLDNEI